MESVGTLAGGIAHDFNNILAIILAYATLIEPAVSESKNMRVAIDAIIKAVRRGTALVRQILTFARKAEYEIIALNVNGIVDEVTEMIRETFPRVITHVQELTTSLPSVHADHTQLHQVLLNLCVNARDAMPDGGVLTVRTSQVHGSVLRDRFIGVRASEYVSIEVQDTGIGMSPEIQQRVFEPFYTTKEKGKGTGLGLAVVFGIMQSHDGFIGVESELGKGTTFRVYLPVPSKSAAPALERADESGDIRGGTETVLVVEDEALLMAVMRSTLMDKGYHVITATDGLQAVQLFAKHRDEIALVLTDIGLPQMSGSEEIVHIRELSPDVRIIVTTGYLDPVLESEMRKAGVVQFLVKPLGPSQILRTVREALDAPGP
jgi:two-component system cell cycle sensor histidine kinase/response regulator CckA